MAEIVHLRLEHGFQELEEMKRIGLFNAKEVRKIAERRSAFEYRLRRRVKKKEDFLQYINFEIGLLYLIDMRRKRLFVDSKKKEIDNSIAKKINRLFKAVISRFPEDEMLWLNQIDYFKRMKWHDSINALYTKILQVHGNKPDLWIQAAKWESENNNSFENARIIFQRAILHHPKCKTLWHEYYRMELQYIEMIKKRREVLQLHNMKNDSDSNDAVLNGEIVNVVYEKALEEIPDVVFSLSFIKICMEFNATNCSLFILNQVSERFPNSEEALDALAKAPLMRAKERVEKEKKKGLSVNDIYKSIYDEIFDKYEAAVQALPTEKMWSFYLDFLIESLNCCTKEKSRLKMEGVVAHKLKEAQDAHCLSKKHFFAWLDVLEQQKSYGRLLLDAHTAAKTYSSTEMWLRCLHLYIKYKPEEVVSLFDQALLDLCGKHSVEPIWKLAVDYLSLNNDVTSLKDFFEKALQYRGKDLVPLREVYLESTALRDGIQAARDLYQKLKSIGFLEPGIVKKMISIEQSQLSAPIELLRKYFEDGVKLFGKNQIDIWLDYMLFETRYGKDPEAVSMVQWRAKKALKSELVDEFQFRIGLLLSEKKTHRIFS